MQEKRQASLDSIMMEIGQIKSIGESNQEWLKDIDSRIRIQNGRVGVLERSKAFMHGMITILVVLVIPIFIKVASEWLIKIGNN